MKRQRHGPHRKLGSTRLTDAASSSWNARLLGTFGALLTERLCDAAALRRRLPVMEGHMFWLVVGTLSVTARLRHGVAMDAHSIGYHRASVQRRACVVDCHKIDMPLCRG
jgi:hypothetical protein